MNIQSLLGSRKCSCGRIHSCDIKAVYIGSGTLDKIKDVTEHYRHVLLVADQNTYKVCGEAVKERLKGNLEHLLIYECRGYLVPDEQAVEALKGKLTSDTDLIMGIGSGVIQDLCKYVSFEAGLPYYIVATAPSMDGYASEGAALIIGGMKVNYHAHVPEIIIGDTDILSEAPQEMLKAGYGDILGKYSCLNDWKLSHAVTGEYFCREIYGLVYEMLQQTKDLGVSLMNRDKKAVQALMEALIGVGIAMAYAGNSRPASGSEHHLSHFFEVIGIVKGEPYLPHGIDVAFSTVYTQRMREQLLKSTAWQTERLFDWKKWEDSVRSVYGKAADGVIALQRRLDWYSMDRRQIYRAEREQIQEILSEPPSSRALEEYLASVGLKLEQFDRLYGEKKIADAIRYAKDLKDRYSVLWMYYELFCMDGNGE